MKDDNGPDMSLMEMYTAAQSAAWKAKMIDDHGVYGDQQSTGDALNVSAGRLSGK